MSPISPIVIFDPDRSISDVLRVELSQVDCPVLMARSTDEAETFARKIALGLIILDASHRKYGAYGACARIRRLPSYATIPIILTSTWVAHRDTVAAATAGATSLLEKPYSIKDLLMAIRSRIPPSDPLQNKLPRPMNTALAWADIAHWRFTAHSALRPTKILAPAIPGRTLMLPLHRST